MFGQVKIVRDILNGPHYAAVEVIIGSFEKLS